MEEASSLKCLGVPVGGVAAVQHQLEAFERLLARYATELVKLRDPQTAMLLLRYCFGSCRMTHCLRAIPRETWGSVLDRQDHMLSQTLADILELRLGRDGRRQCHLPTRMGGLGVPLSARGAPTQGPGGGPGVGALPARDVGLSPWTGWGVVIYGLKGRA